MAPCMYMILILNKSKNDEGGDVDEKRESD